MDTLSSLWEQFGEMVVEVLPVSPFRQFLDSFAEIPYLGYLNWFVPVKGILVVMGSWLVAVGLYYLYSIIMRWLKVIGD